MRAGHIESMRHRIGMVATALLLASSPIVASSAQAEDEKSLGAEVDQAIERALKSLESFIDRFPGYEAPEVTPEGDIIIRKKRPDPDSPPSEPDETRRI